MAETSDRDQKTEQPTAKKRADSAREGDVLMSRELASALMMLAGAGWLFAAGGLLVQSAGEVLTRGLVLGADEIGRAWCRERVWERVRSAVGAGEIKKKYKERR